MTPVPHKPPLLLLELFFFICQGGRQLLIREVTQSDRQPTRHQDSLQDRIQTHISLLSNEFPHLAGDMMDDILLEETIFRDLLEGIR